MESQPLTPISSSTPEHVEVRTPQSVRSEAEPFASTIPPQPTKVTKGRKRKVERVNAKSPVVNGDECPDSGPNHAHNNLHNHHNPCSKRQVIVQNEVLDIPNGLQNGGSSLVDTSTSASPHLHLRNIDSEHHSEAAVRWRKGQNQGHWDGAVRTQKLLFNELCFFYELQCFM